MIPKVVYRVVLLGVLCQWAAVASATSLLYSSRPAQQWQDALISGNGRQGILVFGDPRHERIILNHEMLYEFIGTERIEPAQIADVMPEVKRLIKAGRYQEAKDLTLKRAKEKGHPGILWTDPYHPACVLLMDQDFDGAVSTYTRTGQLDTGEIRVRWQAGATTYMRKAFVSRPDHVMVTELSSPVPGRIHVAFALQHQMNKAKFADKDWQKGGINTNIAALFPGRLESLNRPTIEPAEQGTTEEWLTFRVKYQLVDRGYEVLVQVRAQGGQVSVEQERLVVKNADAVTAIARVIPIEPYAASQLRAVKQEIAALGSYDQLLAAHVALHKPAFDRVVLTLDKTGFTDGSNESLIAGQKTRDRINPYLLEKVFALGRFGLLCSSGQNPPNLMGLWNGEWRPTWSGDFTLDANVNLQIAGANIGSLPEAIDSYMQMLERIAPDWEINARNLYGCRGYLSGTRTSGRRNLATHFGNWPGHYWTAGAEWLLLPCFEYVQCTGDRDFLKKRLLPMMKKVVLFYEDFLDTYDDQGHYFFAPSYSPENAPEGIKPRVAAVANATMDIAVTREALSNLITVCKTLRVEKDSIPRWQAMLEKLPPYLINEDGALKEWAHPDLHDHYDHRHVSHLYPVWPGLEINPEETPDLYQAARVAAQKRGRGNGSAHGLSHMALIGARLKDAELVYGNLLFLMKNDYLNASLFTNHNPGRIYNSDALHSIPGAILEALVYSRPGEIELLPAWSKALPRGSVTNVGCRTEAKVTELRWDLEKGTIYADILSLKTQKITLRVRRGFVRLDVDGKTIAENTDTGSVILKRDKVTHLHVILTETDSETDRETESGAAYEPTWESPAPHYQAPEWFKDAKFGIDTHWGPVTVGAEEGPQGVQWYGRYMHQKDPPTERYLRVWPISTGTSTNIPASSTSNEDAWIVPRPIPG